MRMICMCVFMPNDRPAVTITAAWFAWFGF